MRKLKTLPNREMRYICVHDVTPSTVSYDIMFVQTAEEGDVINDGFDVVEFENPSPIPSPPPTVQLVEGKSLKGSLSTTDSTQRTEHLSTPTGTSVLRAEDKDSLEDADFGFMKRGHENPFLKSHQLTDELFGDTEDEIIDSLVILGTPEAKRVC